MQQARTDIIERYLHAVGFWLPRNQKHDILAELSEDLRSQVEDREAELGRPLEEADIAAILKQRGRPVFVAGMFRPQQRLIGPGLYPIYLLVLKIVALFYLLPWLLVWIGMLIFDGIQSRYHISVGIGSLGTLWTQAFTQFGVITLIFAVIDRVSTTSQLCENWDPRKLPKVKVEAIKRRANAVAGILFGALGLIWLLAVPHFPFLILGPAAYALKPAPIWSSVYGLILLLAVAGIAEHVVEMLRPQLTWFRPVFRFATNGFTLWIIYRLLQTRSYLVATDASTAQYTSVANLMVLICLAGTAFGLAIAMIFLAWQAIQAIYRPRPTPAARIA
jgi:hypothetical protein